jgi:methanogenic corrinoid protein MtbC1
MMIEKISDSIVNLDRDLTINTVQVALEQGLDPSETIEDCLPIGMKSVGKGEFV